MVKIKSYGGFKMRGALSSNPLPRSATNDLSLSTTNGGNILHTHSN